jgi:Pre-rRNA-processing protein TSR2
MEEEKSELFRSALNKIFGQWTAMRYAMETGTAGNFNISNQKKSDLIEETLIYLKEGQNEEYIGDLLFHRMDEDFNISIEDSSESVIAEMAYKIYRQIFIMNDFNISIPELVGGSFIVETSEGEDGGCCSEEESCDCHRETERAMSHKPPKTVVDEDGWTTVRK